MLPDSTNTERLVVFELNVMAPDFPTERRRWNGDLMHSPEASAALNKAVDAFSDSLRADGFAPARTTYGARAITR